VKLNIIPAFMLVVFYALSGCQTIGPSKLVGTTPVQLSKNTSIAFQRYKSSGVGAAFAIPLSGSGSYASNCDYAQCIYPAGSAEEQAVKQCGINNNTTCKLFAIRKNIVWTGPISYPKWSENEYPLVIRKTLKAGRSYRSYTGVAKFNNHKTSFTISVKMGGDQCDGGADLVNETWSINCSEDNKYSGTIKTSSMSMYWGKSHDSVLTISILDVPQNPKSNKRISFGSTVDKPYAASKKSIKERLTELKSFVDEGLLTKKEAAEKRKKILDGL